jgi:y4mF family transcriptional regulator
MKKIGQIIKQRRKNLLITQKELADLSGIGINTLTKIERGEANPSLDVLQKVLDTLGLEVVIQVKKL